MRLNLLSLHLNLKIMKGKIILSKVNQALIQAFEKGYRIDLFGDVFRIGKCVKKYVSTNGYLTFTVRATINDKSEIHKIGIHRMQAYQKYGSVIFDKNLHVRHKDGNCKNNFHDNILIGTPSDNVMDISKELRLKKSIRAASFIKIHNHEEIIKMHHEGFSYGKIMEKTGIKNKGTISFIVKESMASKNSDKTNN